MNKEIHISQESPHGWWIAALIERFEYYDEDQNDPERECLANRNLTLIKANEREEAYSKALEAGTASNGIECVNKDGEKGIWIFEGIETLLPIYD